MKIICYVIFVGVCFLTAACEYKGTPVEYSNTCARENDDKYVELIGFFNNTGRTMCSKSGREPMRCPVDFVDQPGSVMRPIRAWIDRGLGASSIDAEKDQPLRIRDDKGEIIENSQKVKIIAGVTVFDDASRAGDPNSAACYITVRKIERTQ